MSANLQARRPGVRPGVRPVIAITTGEPAGIGPEIAIRAAWAMRHQVNAVLVGDAAFLAMTASAIDPEIRISAVTTMARAMPACRTLAPTACARWTSRWAPMCSRACWTRKTAATCWPRWTPPSKASTPAGSKQ